MEETGGNQLPLIGNIAIPDEQELIENPAAAAIEGQRGIPAPLANWLGQLSLRERFSGAITAGQARAGEFVGSVRQISKAGSVALQGYGQKAGAAAIQAFEKTASFIRNAPEATVDYAALGGVMILMAAEDAIVGSGRAIGRAIGRGFTAIDNRIDGYTPSRQSTQYQPVSQTSYQPYYTRLRYPAPPVRSDMPEWMAPLRKSVLQTPATPRPPAPVPPISTPLSPASSRQPQQARAQTPPLQQPRDPARRTLRAPFERVERVKANYRVVSYHDGTNKNYHFYGPASTVYSDVHIWLRSHPLARYVADEPYADPYLKQPSHLQS